MSAPTPAPTPAYLAFAHLIIDDLELADGTRITGRLGGAGTYAALGMSLASAPHAAALTSGVGADLAPAHRAWLLASGIDTTALAARGPHTPRSRVVYHADGSRTETPSYGHDHFAGMAPAVKDIPVEWQPIAGVYFFAADDEPQWPELLQRARPAAVLWEISAACCRPDRFGAVARRMRDVDVLSINAAEARALCGAADAATCLERLRVAGPAVVVLRRGAAGSLIAAGDRTLQVGAAPAGRVEDATGAGNCYSGAFLAAWCQTHDPGASAAIAAAAATTVLGQAGVPPPADAPARMALAARAAQVTVHESSRRASFRPRKLQRR
jgi:sugar/nucleoside kinase (ribokinase family)